MLKKTPAFTSPYPSGSVMKVFSYVICFGAVYGAAASSILICSPMQCLPALRSLFDVIS